jgi:hypothetical protein
MVKVTWAGIKNRYLGAGIGQTCIDFSLVEALMGSKCNESRTCRHYKQSFRRAESC